MLDWTGVESDLQKTATGLLSRIASGDLDDPAELSSLLYEELRAIARSLMQGERPEHTLQATALVNEAYLRLIGTSPLDLDCRDRFLALASTVMRRILIDHARGANRQKRGGGRARVPLTVAAPEADLGMEPGDLLALDEALTDLAELDARKARVVELRFFGGLDEEVVARVLGIARSTASSDWRFARAWLLNRLRAGDTASESAEP